MGADLENSIKTHQPTIVLIIMTLNVDTLRFGIPLCCQDMMITYVIESQTFTDHGITDHESAN